jgi:signal peptidase I
MLMKAKRRSPGLAVVLSIVTPGLGQVYNGQLRRGVILFVMWALLTVLAIAVLFHNFYGMLIGAALSLGFPLFICVEAVYCARRLGQIILKRYNRWYVYILIIVAVNFIMYPLFSTTKNNHLYKTYKIPSSAMKPTLNVGDHLMADMKRYKSKELNRADIIVFEYPKDPSKAFIKRIISLPGEKIEIIGRKIYIDGKLFEDKYGYYETRKESWGIPAGKCKYCSVTVPDEHYFVLGDNRDNSQDSRYWGFVPLESIRGKALYIYWAKDISRIGMGIE